MVIQQISLSADGEECPRRATDAIGNLARGYITLTMDRELPWSGVGRVGAWLEMWALVGTECQFTGGQKIAPKGALA